MQSSAVELQAGEALPSPRSLSLCRPMCGDPWPLLGRARPPNGLPAFITVPCSDKDVIMDLGACMRVRAVQVRASTSSAVRAYVYERVKHPGRRVLCAGCCVQGTVTSYQTLRSSLCEHNRFFKTIQEKKIYKKDLFMTCRMILINHTINSRTLMQRHSHVDITLFFFLNKQYT